MHKPGYKYAIKNYLNYLPKEKYDLVNEMMPELLKVSRRQWDRYKNYRCGEKAEIPVSKLKIIVAVLKYYLPKKDLYIDNLLKQSPDDKVTSFLKQLES